jgi:hypothetical protein
MCRHMLPSWKKCNLVAYRVRCQFMEMNIMATADGNCIESWPISPHPALRFVPSLFHRLAASKRMSSGPVGKRTDRPGASRRPNNITAPFRQPTKQDSAPQVWNCKFASINTVYASCMAIAFSFRYRNNKKIGLQISSPVNSETFHKEIPLISFVFVILNQIQLFDTDVTDNGKYKKWANFIHFLSKQNTNYVCISDSFSFQQYMI